MTTDAVWNGGMGTSAYIWRGGKEKGKSEKGGATGQGGKRRFPAAVTEVLQPSLSCRHGLRLQVFCRRHLSPNGLVCHCPVWQKQGKTVWGQEKYNSREWSQVQIHARRVLHPAAFPAARQRRKKEMDKTDLSVLHKHIKEVPTTMAVSLWHCGRRGLFFACAIFEMGLRTTRRKPFSKQGNGKIPKKLVMIWRCGIKKVSLQIRKSCLKLWGKPQQVRAFWMSLNRYLKSQTLQFYSVYQSDTAFLIIR